MAPQMLYSHRKVNSYVQHVLASQAALVAGKGPS